jgi:hypothetical protein
MFLLQPNSQSALAVVLWYHNRQISESSPVRSPLPLLPHQLMSYFAVWHHLSFCENPHKTTSQQLDNSSTRPCGEKEEGASYHYSLLERSGKRKPILRAISNMSIRALSPALAVKFNISPGRWQHFPMWPLFLQRDKGKRTEMTGTQHVGNLKHQFIHYITIKMVLVIFHYQNNILVFCTSVIW